MDTWWQTETGMLMITPLPSMALKPGSATKPFPGVQADIYDDSGNPVDTDKYPYKLGWIEPSSGGPILYGAPPTEAPPGG